MSATMNWGCCNADDNKSEEYIKCTKCRKLFHLACVCLPEGCSNPLSSCGWSCPSCTNKVTYKDSTPVRNITMTRGSKRPVLASPPSLSCKEDMQKVVGDILKHEFENMITRIRDELTEAIHQQMQTIKKELQHNISSKIQVVEDSLLEFRKSTDFFNSKFDEIVEEHKYAQIKIKHLEEENMHLKTSVCDLTSKISYMEQQSRANNLEVQCLPEKRNENLYNIIKQIGKVINYDVEDKNILHCTRTAKINTNNSRPRSIVVQFGNPRIRDNFLAACIKFNKANPKNKLNSSHLNYTEKESPIYVCEHLSPSNKALHAATRVKAKERGYKYVWIRNGKIFTRKDDTSEHIFIRNADTLNKIK